VDLLKIDVEGSETDVLLECAGKLQQVDRIFVEYHSFSERPQSLDRLLGILRESGFRYQIQTERAARCPFIERSEYLGMDLQLMVFGKRDA
jgi:hypothetical protein